MKNALKKLREEKGIALVASFMVIAVLLIYSAAFIGVGINQNITADMFQRRVRAYNLAESGSDRALTWLRTFGTPPIGGPWINPWNAGNPVNLGGGTYGVTITDLGETGGTRRYKVTSIGTFGNKSRTMSNYIRVDNFARYIWFTDSETYGGTTVWFWKRPGSPAGQGDYLDGEMHTNTHFNIYGDPVFDGPASSVDNYIRFYNNGNPRNRTTTTNPDPDEPVFSQGFEFGREPTTMPAQAADLRGAASSGGLFLNGNTTVVLNSNGTMNVTNAARGWNNQNMAVPANGALFVACGGTNCSQGGTLTISGMLNGQLTAGAQRNIVIPNSVVYANDPRDDDPINHPETVSDDVLGLISERNVLITNSAPNNLEIDGCIMSMNTSFMRDNYSSGLKGTLTVYGGIIQDERGPVGSFNGSTGQKLSGYDKNYRYDDRLLTTPPPFMPTTGDYITLSWEEE